MGICKACRRKTDLVCERHSQPVCPRCECVWVVENRTYEHVIKGAATPYLRWYMGKWPRELPPPKTKRMARDASNIEPLVGHMLETMCNALSPVWDREDTLLVIAECAMRVHARDARTIDRWNDYVARENAKRRRRVLKGWTNGYYSRQLKEVHEDDNSPGSDTG